MHDSSIIKGIIWFDPKDQIYKDHFPGNPVIPGSIIMDAFIQAAKLHKPGDKITGVENFKFKKFISPGKFQYELHIKPAYIKCKLFDDTVVVATGTLTNET